MGFSSVQLVTMILWINGYRVSAKTRAVLVLPYLFESILVHATETSCTVLTYRMHFFLLPTVGILLHLLVPYL